MARAKKTPAKKKPTAKSKTSANAAAAPKKKIPAKKADNKRKSQPPKAAPKKRKAAPRTTAAKAAPKRKVAPKKSSAGNATSAAARQATTDLAELFAPLSEGERADSLRILLEDPRLANMAKVGRYRVIAVEPLALKTTPAEARRLARIVIYDYSADRCVEANVDLDSFALRDLSINRSQPMLAVEEEQAAMEIAVTDDRVRTQLGLGEVPLAAMHYWSQRPSELSHNRRSAAVLLGEPGERPTLVAIVDLLDAQVTEVVPGQNW